MEQKYDKFIFLSVLDHEGTVELPIEFQAKKAGHYSCKVVLRSDDDVRVHQIECTVIPEGHEAQIEFSVALHQPLSQSIPIVSIYNCKYNHKMYSY